MWPFRGKDPFSGCEVEEGHSRSVKVDVKSILPGRRISRCLPEDSVTYLDSSKDLALINIMIASIDNTFGVWPALLGCSDCRPKNSFTSATSITGTSQQQL